MKKALNTLIGLTIVLFFANATLVQALMSAFVCLAAYRMLRGCFPSSVGWRVVVLCCIVFGGTAGFLSTWVFTEFGFDWPSQKALQHVRGHVAIPSSSELLDVYVNVGQGVRTLSVTTDELLDPEAVKQKCDVLLLSSNHLEGVTGEELSRKVFEFVAGGGSVLYCLEDRDGAPRPHFESLIGIEAVIDTVPIRRMFDDGLDSNAFKIVSELGPPDRRHSVYVDNPICFHLNGAIDADAVIKTTDSEYVDTDNNSRFDPQNGEYSLRSFYLAAEIHVDGGGKVIALGYSRFLTRSYLSQNRDFFNACLRSIFPEPRLEIEPTERAYTGVEHGDSIDVRVMISNRGPLPLKSLSVVFAIPGELSQVNTSGGSPGTSFRFNSLATDPITIPAYGSGPMHLRFRRQFDALYTRPFSSDYTRDFGVYVIARGHVFEDGAFASVEFRQRFGWPRIRDGINELKPW